MLHDSAAAREKFLPVRAWRVTYALEYRGTVVPPDSRGIWLVDESFRRSAVDTSDGDGRVARRVRVVPDSLEITGDQIDTITVVISATWRGQPLAGSPRRLKLPVRPAQPTAR